MKMVSLSDICTGSQILFCLIDNALYFQSELVYFDIKVDFGHNFAISFQ